jgi:Ca-activated chloride channel family protein
MRTFALASLSSLLAFAASAQVVRPLPCPPNADCIVRPGPARIVRTGSDVRVTLEGRVLRYEIEERFVNRGGVVGEADYVLPLPRGAAFENLALEINGELVAGEALNADRARSIYEEIVRRSKDPALVEWMGHGLLRTRIFPIAPGETKRVVVRFRAVAEREGNALRVEYLGAGKSAGSLETVAPPSLILLLPRGEMYGTPFSPTHQIDVGMPRHQNESATREVRVRGDASHLTLLVPVREASRATVTTLPYAPPGEDGFAMITLSPPAGRPVSLPRDVTFVIDVSGSMQGAKLEQAKAAGRTLLGSLGRSDRFRLISFSTDVEEFGQGWTAANDEQIRVANRWLTDLRAVGSTNIEGALDRALEGTVHRGRLGVVLFLTDGAATVGERNPDRLAEMAARRHGAQRVFTFGVGSDVQAAMLERIAIEGRGTAHFVQPNEDVEHAVGVVAQRLSAPIATNIRLLSDGVTLRQIQPGGQQDLFVGQDMTLFVRYRGSGPATLTFAGDSPDGPVRWTERVTFPDRSRENAFVAKLWAVQRVGWLSAERRRSGPNAELDSELRELGTKYSIPTELTSYLVLEPGMQVPPTATLQSRAANGVSPVPVQAQAFEAARAAADQRAAKSLADAAGGVGSATGAGGRAGRDEAAIKSRQVGDRTFMLKEGRWLDGRYKEQVRRVSVKPFSSAYFALIERLPELKGMFALGERVTVAGRNVTVLLDAAGVESLSVPELAAVVRDW